ncbi:hypothetical protein CcaCcLH18_12150 [Colletotrichum camelliae]|nr:hypothetical protein CcaCcLH18_12150 [Colletotrichum camelliae]
MPPTVSLFLPLQERHCQGLRPFRFKSSSEVGLDPKSNCRKAAETDSGKSHSLHTKMHNQFANTAGDTSQEAENQHDQSHDDDALLRQVRDLESELKAEKEKSAKLEKMLSTRTAEYNELKAQVGMNNAMLGGLIEEVKTLQNHVRQGHESLEAEMKALNPRTGSSAKIADKKGDKGEQYIEENPKRGRGRPRKRSEAETSCAPQKKRGRPRMSLD